MQANCTHCGGEINTQSTRCAHCGIPLLKNQHNNPQRKFILFFIAVTIFCLAMILWLPPDWSLIKR
jgi:predicted nucleic acid-binding Zn ribbon protein